ncbi:hypothetical protein KFE25_006076 [Diacronema lutheri]|uniref:Nucleotide-diphospho-sugar transferase domain-containing protein n=1 Tax=Diacronema lutheri TaxID=2081491 RepID=A0A8J5XV90_DIALT|nr:hypothetical protein KFE25_006076 [Diacronema lutheri]
MPPPPRRSAEASAAPILAVALPFFGVAALVLGALRSYGGPALLVPAPAPTSVVNSTNETRAADGIDGYAYTPGRGIVIIGDGCFVPLAYTSAYLLAQYALNIKVALFTSAEGVGTAAKLAAAFGQDPFERVVDATALLDQHDARMQGLGRNRTCAFRLQKIIAHIYAPFEHSLIMDADNFPCSRRVRALFDEHDAAGSQAMLMYDPTRPGIFNGGFQLAKRTPEVRRFKVHWLKKVARSCKHGIHIRRTERGVNYVLDQPDMNYLLQRWTQKVNSTKPYDVIAPDLQACRPEMWAGGDESARYLQAMGQPGNVTLLDSPPCPFAHINPFKFPWFLPEKVDAFCSVRGLGDTSTILYRVMEVAFNDTTGLGIHPATARWCLKQVRGTRENHDNAPHFIDGR